MKEKKLWILMFIGLFLRLIYLFKENVVWWDGSVYLGMGKYIFSSGTLGIWEPIRPLVMPLLLGSTWKLGFDPIVVGRLLEIAFSLGAVYLTYLIGKRYRTEEEGLIAATILCFTPVFFKFAFRLYTEIPSTFFALLAVYLFMRREMIYAGIFSALAFLTKFPQGIVIFVLGVFSIDNLKKTFKLGAAFLITVIPYLAFNYIKYGNPIKPFRDGSYIIKYAGVWLFAKPWWFYFYEMLRQNVLYVFAIIGIFTLLKKKHRVIPTILILFLVYFSTMAHKEPRFMLLFLPYLALLAAIGIRKLFRQKAVFWIVLAVSLTILFVHYEPNPNAYKGKEAFFTHLEGKKVEGEVLVSHPYINLFTDTKVIPMYYMVFDSNLAKRWTLYINENSEKISYVFIDTCEGGMLCPPWDKNCEAERQKLIEISEDKFEKVFFENRDGCRYYIFGT